MTGTLVTTVVTTEDTGVAMLGGPILAPLGQLDGAAMHLTAAGMESKGGRLVQVGQALGTGIMLTPDGMG